MNIFLLSKKRCPIESAQMHCDTHVVSQVKEAAQILSNCFSVELLASPDCPKTQKGNARKHSYPHHPCCKWASLTSANMEWMIEHSKALFDEFEMRNQKRHFTRDFLEWIIDNKQHTIVPNGSLTEFPVAIKSESNCLKVRGFENLSVVEKYRQYYLWDKPFATWGKGRETPTWFNSHNKNPLIPDGFVR